MRICSILVEKSVGHFLAHSLHETTFNIQISESGESKTHIHSHSLLLVHSRSVIIAKWVMGIIIFLMVLGYGILQYYFSSKMINKRVNDKVKKRIMTIPSSYYDVSLQETSCSICLTDFCKGEKVSVLPCAHVFHYQCIVPWLGKQSKVCPVCRLPFYRGKDLVELARLGDV